MSAAELDEMRRDFRRAFPWLYGPRPVCDHDWQDWHSTPNEWEPSLVSRWRECRKCRATMHATRLHGGFRLLEFRLRSQESR